MNDREKMQRFVDKLRARCVDMLVHDTYESWSVGIYLHKGSALAQSVGAPFYILSIKLRTKGSTKGDWLMFGMLIQAFGVGGPDITPKDFEARMAEFSHKPLRECEPTETHYFWWRADGKAISPDMLRMLRSAVSVAGT